MGSFRRFAARFGRARTLTGASLRYVTDAPAVLAVPVLAVVGVTIGSAGLFVAALLAPPGTPTAVAGLVAVGAGAFGALLALAVSQAGVAAYVALDCAPGERATVSEVYRRLAARPGAMALWAVAYPLAQFALLATVALGKGFSAVRLPRWPYTALLAPAMALEGDGLRTLARANRERFEERWPDSDGATVGYWTFLTVLIYGLVLGGGAFVLGGGLTTAAVDSPLAAAFWGLFLAALLGGAVVLTAASVLAAWITCGVVYAAAREWPVPPAFEGVPLDRLFGESD